MNTVSVIIPTYNRAHTLLKCINSALAQTHPVQEVIVCDDGSTDGTKEIVNTISDKRVKYLDCGRNGRPAIPRNQGIKASSGEWLAFLDSDDEWLPEKLKKQYHQLQQSGNMASCTNALRIVPGQELNKPLLDFHASSISFLRLVQSNEVICSSAMVHRSVIQKAEGFPEEIELKALEDYALWLRIILFSDFSYVDEALVKYTDAPAQSIRNEEDTYWKQRLHVFGNLKKWASQHQNFIGQKQKEINYQWRKAQKKTGIYASSKERWLSFFIR
jgi:teichuronic acid biosynthesis glycosyltransferase TuaG